MTDPRLLSILVQQDAGLSKTEKEYLLQRLTEPTILEHLVHGTTGAGVALIVSKYLALPKNAQILLSIAGFGIGKYLLDTTQKRDKFIQYNDKLNTYNINA